MTIQLILLIPVLVMVLLLFVKNGKGVNWVSFIGSLIQLGWIIHVGVEVMIAQAHGKTGFIYEERYQFLQSLQSSFHFGIDGLSYVLLLLTAAVVVAGVLMSWNENRLSKEFHFLLWLLSFGAYGFFLSQDSFVMFLFLEVAVLPKYLLISNWGSGNRAKAANKLALMLMLGSGFILVGLLGLYFSTPGPQRSFDLAILAQQAFSPELQGLYFPFLFIGFGIFTALFPFHTWVPDGHSSAPTAGSMFLAGISMKMGGYGCFKVAIYLLPEGAKHYATWIVGISAIGILYGALVTLRQKDLKYMNAYSSISHCGFVLLGLGSLNATASTGAVLQLISHGLMTALFFGVIGMVYSRTHTREIAAMSGLQKKIPFIITLLYIAGLCSLGLPGLSGFTAEMTIFNGTWAAGYKWATIVAASSIVVTAVYILRAVTKIAMGPASTDEHFTDASWQEKVGALVLIFFILALGISPNLWVKLVQVDIVNLLGRMN